MEKYLVRSLGRDTGSCSTIIIGKNASATGKVLLAHNEDDYDSTVQVHLVPRVKHKGGDTISFGDGKAVIPEVPETYAYYWSELRSLGGISFADGFVNEFGVAVVTDSCRPCKEAQPADEENGLGYGLRRLIAERARTAREGVEIAAALIEKYGYFSARCYHICDKEEAWAVQVTQGHRYAARRIPDDGVYYIPNWYTIHTIDWNDAAHKEMYFSKDVAEYAARQGWYTPKAAGDYSNFDFAEAYQAPDDNFYNEVRARNAWRLLTGSVPADLRIFCQKAEKKYTPDDLKKIMRSHYEGSEDDISEGYTKNPHWVGPWPTTICNSMTAESMIVEFHEITDLTCMWRACPKPCLSPYVPWYLGNLAVPCGYEWTDPLIAQTTHFCPAEEELRYNPARAYWAFRTLQYLTEFDYGMPAKLIHPAIAEIEKEWVAEKPLVEETYKKLLDKNEKAAKEYLTQYTAGKAAFAWNWANDMIQKVGEERILDNNPTVRALYE